MKFICDVMLGKLAKRLRLLGFDVLYDRTLEDNQVIRISLEQDRIILTRDGGLAARPLARNHLHVDADDPAIQVLQVLSFLDRTAPSHHPVPFTRCTACNGLLAPVSKREVKDVVPDHVYAAHDDFLQCPGCGRIYWRGTHIERMQQLPGMKQMMETKRAPRRRRQDA